MIRYTTSLDGVAADMLSGFFVGWPKHPAPSTHLDILQNSRFVVLAIDDEAGRVVGFANVLSDGIMSAYIPLLEVLPDYQGKGIGTELVKRVLEECKSLYMVDTTCDPELRRFYTRCGMKNCKGMMIRNHNAQSGNVKQGVGGQRGEPPT